MNLQQMLQAGFSRLVPTRGMTDEEFAEAIQMEGDDTIISPDAEIAINGNEHWVRSWTRIDTDQLGETT